jgi:hypothetical protein
MATPDLAQLQEILNNAGANEQRIAAIKKAYSRLEVAFNDFGALLADDYQPTPKERKPRQEGAKKPGRPKKNTDAQ